MKKLRLFGLLLLNACFINAQEICSFSIYFATNEFRLTATAKSKLDSVIKNLTNIHCAYIITIAGHTDNEGDPDFNKKLSIDRAEHTKRYFLEKGFYSKHISTDAFAYTKPIATNGNEIGKSMNRRVTVTVSAYTPDIAKVFNPEHKTVQNQLDANKGGKLKYNTGSELIVPPDAFETMNGERVIGKVDIKYIEYRNPVDFIASGIPMSFHNNENELVQFNSGGMFRVEAFQNANRLKLKDGTDIKVNFMKTQVLPEMRFFGYDSVNNKWALAMKSYDAAFAQLRTTTSDGMTKVYTYSRKSITKYINGKDSCVLYPCAGTAMAIRKGVEWASSDRPISVFRPKVSFKDNKNPYCQVQAYQVKIISTSYKGVEFQIIPLNSPSVFDSFKEYHWVYEQSKKFPFKNSWDKTIWLRIKVDYLMTNDFYLTFYSNSEKFTLPVKAKINAMGMSLEEQEQYHLKNKQENLNLVLGQMANEKNYDNRLMVFNSEYFSEQFKDICTDSLQCFYQYSRPWAEKSTGEDTLNFERWLDYFNSHKAEMKVRYLKKQYELGSILVSCKTEDKKMAEKIVYQRKIDSLNVTAHDDQTDILEGMFQQLSIKNLGIWNCDQVQRLKDPVYVKRTYKNNNGKKVEPIIVYLIDKAVNGTLTYNGYMGLSPYYFPVSSKSENTLIAFDINNKAYVCKAPEMKNVVQQKDFSEITLTPLAKSNIGEQISAVMK